MTGARSDGFSSAGGGTVAAGARSEQIVGESTPAGAKILVTLGDKHGAGKYVKYVERNSNTSFTVWLNQPPAAPVRFSYFVIR